MKKTTRYHFSCTKIVIIKKLFLMGEKKECPSAAIKLTKTWHHSLNFVLDPLRLFFC